MKISAYIREQALHLIKLSKVPVKLRLNLQPNKEAINRLVQFLHDKFDTTRLEWYLNEQPLIEKIEKAKILDAEKRKDIILDHLRDAIFNAIKKFGVFKNVGKLEQIDKVVVEQIIDRSLEKLWDLEIVPIHDRYYKDFKFEEKAESTEVPETVEEPLPSKEESKEGGGIESLFETTKEEAAEEKE